MKKLTLITSLIISFNLYAQPFSLVKEINTTATNSSFSSSLMQRVGTTVYFIANDGINGNELWKSDGTNAGTVMVKDITPGSGNTLFINFTAGDGLLFFTANDGVNGYELWRTDGTDAGTFIVRDGFSECTFCLNRYFFHNGFLYFAGDDGTGAELWKTDGTTAGTVLVKDIFPGPTTSHPAPTSNVNYTFVALGNDVYFSAVDAAGGRELFKTDGTEGGTVMVKDIFPGATSSISTVNHKAAVFNGKVYFAANDGTNGVELWATDGTEAGTYLVKDIVAGSGSAQPNNLIAYNGALYFTASTTNNAAPDLYKTDGTEAGTVLVKNLVADGITLTIGNSSGIDQFTIANNKLFFRGNGPSGFELYATDGTTDGTGLAKDLYPGVNGVNPNGLLSFNNNLYFHGIDFGLPSRGGALYKSDGSAAGTEILTDAIGGLVGAASAAFASANGRLFFYGNTNDHGTELWSTDGTSANTNLVKDINATKIGTPNSGAFFLGSTVFNGYYYYAAVDDSHGNELWKSDGTTAGTMMVKDIWPGKAPSNPAQFFVFNGALYFTASDGVTGTEIWKTDGTQAGTFLVKDINPGPVNSGPNRFGIAGNFLYFMAYHSSYGTELWRSDGTAAGTSMVIDLIPGAANGVFGIQDVVTLGTNAYLILSIASGNVLGIPVGNRIIKIDGLTNTVTDFAPVVTSGTDLGLVGSTLYISGRNAAGNTILWKSENGGAVTQVKILSTTATNAYQLTNCGGKLYFNASNGTAAGSEPWISDGTDAGTYMLKDINPGINPSTPHQFVLSGDKVYFTASSTGISNSDHELWATDGTEAGTYLVKDIQPGINGSRPNATISAYGNKVLFTANDGTTGYELWESDGTAAGTFLKQEFNTSGDGIPLTNIFINFNTDFVYSKLNDKILFFARSADKGLQLYSGSIARPSIYVNDNSTSNDVFTTAIGSDANNGSQSAPYATLNYAVSQAIAGDTIYVDAGSYPMANLTINKSITILGPNYNISPNNAANKTQYNSGRNAEAIIPNAYFVVGADLITIKGLRFSSDRAIILSADYSHLKLDKNYFDVSLTTSSVNLAAVTASPIVAFDFSITDNRFERTDLLNGNSINIGAVKNVLIDNNVFIESPASGTPNRGTALRTASTQKVENTVFSNNYLKKLGISVNATYVQDFTLNNNVFDSCASGLNHIPGSFSSNTVHVSENTFINSRSGRSILVRSAFAGGGVSNLTINNNIINQEVDGTNGYLGMVQLDFGGTGSFGSVSVLSNKINISGNYANSIANPNCAIILIGKHSNTTISTNELNFNAINIKSFGFNILPPVPTGIYFNTDNGAGSEIPANAVFNITNNKINGFKSNIGIYDPSATGLTSFVGYGMLTTGATVNINNNSLTNDSMSIDNGLVSQAVFATCNWYGSADAEVLATKLSTQTVVFTPWLTNGTDNEPSTTGFQQVPGNCNGRQNRFYVNDNSQTGDVLTTAIGNNSNNGFSTAPFATIQYAIDQAQAGDEIYVDAGTYVENVIVNKSVTLRGVKHGQQPGASLDRGNETIIIPAVTNLALIGGSIIRAAADNITIDGFMLDGDNPNLASGTLVNGVDVNAGTAIFNDNIVAAYLTVKNNIVKNTGTYGIGLFRASGITTGPVVPGALFTQNRVDNSGLRGIVLAYSAYGSITNNYITRCTNSGTWFSQQNVANINNEPGIVSGNYIEVRSLAMQSSSLGVNASAVHYLNNEIKGTGNTTGLSLNLGNPGGAVIANNKFADVVTGVSVSSSVAGAPVLVNNNSFTNIGTKIIASFTANMVSADCNWLDGTNGEMIASKMTGNINYIPWLTDGTDTDPVVRGFQPQAGVCTGRPTRLYVNDNDLTGDVFTTAVGNDANSGLRAFPFATINYALTQAQAGDTIFVDAGTYISGGTISKAITILGTNYLISPNDAADPLLPNAGRNAESIINNSTYTIGASNIRCSGLTFNPGSVSQFLQTNNLLDFSNIDISKNRFIINSNVILISLTGRNISPLSTNNYTISNNRFEKTSGTAGNCMQLSFINNVGITANVFTPASASMSRVQSSVSMGSTGKVDNLTISNNIFDRSNGSINTIRLGASLIENNKCYNVGGGFSLLNLALEPATVTVRGNYFSNGNGGISYFRNNTTDISAPNKFICEDNVVNILVVTDGPSFPAGVLIASTGPSSVLSANVIMETEIRRNIFNYSGDLGQIANFSTGGIRISNRHTGLVIESNEINLNVVNNTSPGSMPSSGIIVYHNNSVSSAFSSSAVINIRNNKISNFKQSIMFYDVIGQRYGGLATGMTVNINENSFTGDSISINNGTISKIINTTCNWYGNTSAQAVLNKITPSTLNYTPWLTNGTDNDVATGFQPVPGSCDGYPPVITLNSATDITCNGANNGSIQITATYGKAPFTFTWTKEGDAGFISHNEDLSNLTPGTYHLALVDGNGSNIYVTNLNASGPETISVTITEPPVLTASATGTNNFCFGNTAGSAAVTAGGGTAPYTYSWSNGGTADEIFNLAAGVYTVTVTDANSCTKQASYEVTQPTLLTASIANNSTACSNIAVVTAGGGTAPYSYSWSNGSTSETISSVPVGTYTVTVTDANGCTASESISLTVSQAFNPSVSITDVSCFGTATGSLTITNANGNAPFSFSIDGVNFVPGAFPFTFSNLTAGTYSVAVRDVNGCTGFNTKTISQPTALVATLGTVQSTCAGESTGSINVSVSGGSTAYNYNWTKTGGGFSSSKLNISGLAVGSYTLTVTDKNGCIRIVNATVPAYPSITVTSIVQNILCKGETNGSIDLSVSGGTGSGFSYLWNSGATTEDRFNLGTGNYTVTITDIGSGCTESRSFTITQPATAINLSAGKSNVLGCNSPGTVTASGSGGTAPFQYSLNGGAYQSSGSFTGLYAGNYTVTVRDATGCTKSSAILNIADNGTDEYESNNSKNKASQINVGTVINARIATTGDPADWFKFTTSSAGNYTVSLTHPSAGFSYNLFTASGNTVLIPVSTTANSKTYSLVANADYTISVTGGLSYICYSLLISNGTPLIVNKGIEQVIEKTNKLPAIQDLQATVYPNPHKGAFNLRIDSPQEGPATIQLMTVDGKIIISQHVKLQKSLNILYYEGIHHSALFYRVIMNNKSVAGKIIGPN